MKAQGERDFYQVLGIHPEASDEEIKTAYRELARIHHPDSHASKSNPEVLPNPDIFKAITEAYAMLSNPEKRQEYDSWLSRNNPSSSIHWLKAGTKNETPISRSANVHADFSRPGTLKKKPDVKLNLQNERIRLAIISAAGVLLGICAALLLFLLIKALFF